MCHITFSVDKNADGTEKFAILYGYPNAPVDSKTNEEKQEYMRLPTL